MRWYRISDCESERSCLVVLKVKTFLTSEDGQDHGTIPMQMFASRPLATGINTELFGRTAKQQMSELQFVKFHSPASFLVRKTRFKSVLEWF